MEGGRLSLKTRCGICGIVEPLSTDSTKFTSGKQDTRVPLFLYILPITLVNYNIYNIVVAFLSKIACTFCTVVRFYCEMRNVETMKGREDRHRPQMGEKMFHTPIHRGFSH